MTCQLCAPKRYARSAGWGISCYICIFFIYNRMADIYNYNYIKRPSVEYLHALIAYVCVQMQAAPPDDHE